VNWAEIELAIRDKIHDPNAESVDQQLALRVFNEVYRQWAARFSPEVEFKDALAQMDSGDRYKDIATAEVERLLDLTSFYISGDPAARPSDPGVFEIEKIALEDLMGLRKSEEANEAVYAVGVPATNARPKFMALIFLADTGWRLIPYPAPDTTYHIFGMARTIPELVAVDTDSFACTEDDLIGLAMVTALRLLPDVGYQNDQGTVQAIVSGVPQNLQSWAAVVTSADFFRTGSPESPA
jgi:hypothetical protein